MHRLFATIFLVCSISCTTQLLSPDELKSYALDPGNGLVQRVDKGGLILEMCYKPKSLVLMQESQNVSDEKEKLTFEKRIEKLDYFVLFISKGGREIESNYVTDSNAFKEVVDYLSFNIADDLFMICEGDTVFALDAAYARSFSISKATSIMAVFDSDLVKSDKNATVYFDDKHFGTGLNAFEFKNKNIQLIPDLKTK
jgi:hypothetical protein